jgi:hypothetical protein
MSDYIIAKIAKLMINAKTKSLVTKIVEAAMAERARDIMITLADAGEDSAAEMIAANWKI